MEQIGVLYNTCYGGFSFSSEFVDEFERRTGQRIKYNYQHNNYRDHSEAVKIFEEMGSEWSSGDYSKLDIAYVPACMKEYYQVGEYDGKEDICIRINCAIVDKTDEYLRNPTPEKLEWLKDQINLIRSFRIQ